MPVPNIELGRLWAGTPEAFHALNQRMGELTPQVLEQLEAKARADDSADDDSGEPRSRLSTRVGTIGVVKVAGSLVDGGFPWLNAWLGATGYDEIRNAVLEFALDDNVTSILLDINSGGGQVSGMSDVADLVASVDENAKPVFSHTGGAMCSAAYYVGCAARGITAASMADVGSIGVLIVQRSVNRAMTENGIDVHVIRAGEFKAMGNPYEELSDKAREVLQASCDYTEGLFLEHVAEHRNVTAAYAKGVMGEGRIFIGQQALEVGLVDGIASFDEALQGAVVAKKFDFLQHETSYLRADTDMKKKMNPLLAAAREAALKAAQEAEDRRALEASAGGDGTVEGTGADDGAGAEGEGATTPAASAQGGAEGDAGVAVDEVVAEQAADVIRLEAKVELLQKQLSEQTKELLAEQRNSAKLAERLDAQAASAKAMRTIAEATVDHLNIALGRAAGTMAKASDEQVVAEHARLSEEFDANFKAGGVAVLSAKQETAKADPGHANRLKAARLQ